MFYELCKLQEVSNVRNEFMPRCVKLLFSTFPGKSLLSLFLLFISCSRAMQNAVLNVDKSLLTA